MTTLFTDRQGCPTSWTTDRPERAWRPFGRPARCREAPGGPKGVSISRRNPQTARLLQRTLDIPH